MRADWILMRSIVANVRGKSGSLRVSSALQLGSVVEDERVEVGKKSRLGRWVGEGKGNMMWSAWSRRFKLEVCKARRTTTLPTNDPRRLLLPCRWA